MYIPVKLRYDVNGSMVSLVEVLEVTADIVERTGAVTQDSVEHFIRRTLHLLSWTSLTISIAGTVVW